jgi:hypothetical protein
MVFIICLSGFEDNFLVTFASDLFAVSTLLDFKAFNAQNTIQTRANQPETAPFQITEAIRAIDIIISP